MRGVWVVGLAVLMGLAGCGGEQAEKGDRTTQPEVVEVDGDYILALSTVNRFLEAWRHRDADAGLAVLSERLLKSRGEEAWRQDICGCSNPHHASYEVANGQRLKDGRYAFEVQMYEYYTGDPPEMKPRGKSERMVAVKVGLEEWRVDETPSVLTGEAEPEGTGNKK